MMLAVGCASSRPNYTFMTPTEWREELIRRGVDVRQIPNPLGVVEAMRKEALDLAGNGTAFDRLQRLQSAFFDEKAFPFRYQNRGTYTAVEAFAPPRGQLPVVHQPLRRDGPLASASR